MDGCVGGADGLVENALDGERLGVRGDALQEGSHGHLAGDFAGGHAAHTVAHHVNLADRIVAERVFVVGTDTPDVAEGSDQDFVRHLMLLKLAINGARGA